MPSAASQHGQTISLPASVDRALLERDDCVEYLAGFLTPRRRRRFEQVLVSRTRHLTVVLEDLHQPHNASACLRSCDGFGLQEVHIIEHRHQFSPNPDVALGASQWLDLVRHQGAEATSHCIEHLKERGYGIVATSSHGDARPLESFDVDRKIALLFGSEKDGLSAQALQLADARLTIPMYGFSESFNISVAVAICLHDLTHRLRQSQIDWRLTPEDLRQIRTRWIVDSLGTRRTAQLMERFSARTGTAGDTPADGG